MRSSGSFVWGFGFLSVVLRMREEWAIRQMIIKKSSVFLT